MRLCVIGDSGLLGQALVKNACSTAGNHVLGFSRAPFEGTRYWPSLHSPYAHRALDIANQIEIAHDEINRFQPDVIVNCAAIVNLMECERDPQMARQIHAIVAGEMAKQAKKIRATFVQISTDQVFDGKSITPYSETDPVNPLNVYGKSKRQGEEEVLAANPEALVIRTNIVGFRDRAGSATFAEWLVQSFAHKQPIKLFEDYVTSSMHVDDFTSLLWLALERKIAGLLHIASHEPLSKYEFGRALAEAGGFDFSTVEQGLMAGAPMTPPRPPYLGLNVTRAESLLGRRCPSNEETVQKLAQGAKIRPFGEQKYATT